MRKWLFNRGRFCINARGTKEEVLLAEIIVCSLRLDLYRPCSVCVDGGGRFIRESHALDVVVFVKSVSFSFAPCFVCSFER